MNQPLIRLGCCLCIVSLATPSESANKPKASTPADPVQQVLLSEIDARNSNVDRREALRPAGNTRDETSSSRWQAGYVSTGKEWRPLEQTVVAGEEAANLEVYCQQRAELVSQPHGKWMLAQWCRKNGLPDQERVHLLQALAEGEAALNLDVAYQRLGCQRVGDRWVSPQERREAAELAAEIEKSHKQWSGRLKSIAALLEGTPKQHAVAEKQLSEIAQVSAVAAIVDQFSLTSPPQAEFAVKALGQIPEFQASRALAGQAVFSPWKPVRSRTTELLKQRKLTEFVPDLLLLLSAPVRTKAHVTGQVKTPNGNLLNGSSIQINWDYVWVEETQDTIRVGIRRLFPLSFAANTVQVVSNARPSIRGFYDRTSGQRVSDVNDQLAMLELIEQAETLDYAAEQTNDFRAEMNNRVGRVLSDCTGEPVSAEPQKWWDYWTTYSSVSPSEKKVAVVDQRKYQPQTPSFSRAVIQRSCLVAGTPVWTDRGFVSIERIQAGDRVLSKDISSGELAYKPVLQTTVREPTTVHKFRVGDDQISASLGHHFWVSGEGWTKMRDFVPQQPLHTATGMQRITDIEDEGRIEKVYNLVVADFHTYFVGESMILSHDVTVPKLSNVKVPGLAGRSN